MNANPPEYITARHRIRTLVNGLVIAEERKGWLFPEWHAIDLKSPQFYWAPSDQYYRDCLGTRDQAINAIAHRGA